MNKFSLGAQIGGTAPHFRERSDQEQELRNFFNNWTGSYTDAIQHFAFLLRIDGHIHEYTKMWNILGAQKAKRKREWVEVEIGIPVYWYPHHANITYRCRLVLEVEKGLRSMIDLLERNRHSIDREALLTDWAEIKRNYLAGDPFVN
jgi:hypothetical protein